MSVQSERSSWRARWRSWAGGLRARALAAFQTPGGVARGATLLALLPTPLWFVLSALSAPGPAWRAVYHEQPDFSGEQAEATERRLSRYWDRDNRRVPGAFNVRHISAVFDTCLTLRDPRAIPFQLVANGTARMTIDGQERLRAGKGQDRDARGEVLELAAGTHHVRVEFSAGGWPSIALNASLDGRAPVAVPPEHAVSGVTWSRPQPGIEPCTR